MFKHKTVLVLGAGASYPYGFPLGTTLRTHILQNDAATDRIVFGDCQMPQEAAKQFRHAFRESRVQSIDAFLEHADERDRIFGKRLIAANISKHENPSSLLPDAGDWMMFLFDLLGRNASAENLGDNNLTIVTFNYDRSFEYSLITHIRYKYRLPPREAREISEMIPVIHVHGSLGELAYENSGGIVGYGNGGNYIMQTAERLTIVHDEREKDGNVESARNLIESADRVIFLGFSFHELNCESIFSGSRQAQSKWWSCGYGMTPAEQRIVKRMIPKPPNTYGAHAKECQVSIEFGDPNHDSLAFLRHIVDELVD